MNKKSNSIKNDENTKESHKREYIIFLNKKYNEKNNIRVGTYDKIKRICDLFYALIGIIILSPLFVLVSILIKIETEGSVIFSQERIGKNGEIFHIYKFRSMKLNAPDVSDRELLDSKSYMTKVGRFIRRTSIDELPQLINILKGEMSFVGPRPFILNEGEINILRAKNGIHTLIPGLTGWAQVSDRNTNNDNHKLDLDLYYLKNRSLFLDFKILIRTLFTTIGR